MSCTQSCKEEEEKANGRRTFFPLLQSVGGLTGGSGERKFTRPGLIGLLKKKTSPGLASSAGLPNNHKTQQEGGGALPGRAAPREALGRLINSLHHLSTMKARPPTILILAVLVAAEAANGQTEGSSGGDATATKLEEEAATNSDETQVTEVHLTCTLVIISFFFRNRKKDRDFTESKTFCQGPRINFNLRVCVQNP